MYVAANFRLTWDVLNPFREIVSSLSRHSCQRCYLDISTWILLVSNYLRVTRYIDTKSFQQNFVIKTIPLFGISYNRNHWWNHYHKCAIIAHVCAQRNISCHEIEMSCKTDERVKLWKWLRMEREKEEERDWRVCERIVMPISKTFSIYSHDIRVYHAKPSKMHVLSVDPSKWWYSCFICNFCTPVFDLVEYICVHSLNSKCFSLSKVFPAQQSRCLIFVFCFYYWRKKTTIVCLTFCI